MPVAEASVTIDAPIDVVWQVMLDIAAYDEWNPFIYHIDGPRDRPPAVGDDLGLHVRWHTGGTVQTTERITRLEPPSTTAGVSRAELEYDFLGPLAGLHLVQGRRQQTLTQTEGGPTGYHTREHLHGLLAWATPIGRVREGFARHSRALKQRAEAARSG